MLTKEKEVEMGKIKRVRKTFLSMSLSLIITFALLIHVNFAKAEEVGGISPNQMEEINCFCVVGGQTASKTFTISTPFDFQRIYYISYFNRVLEASLASDMKGPFEECQPPTISLPLPITCCGQWGITLLGTGGTYPLSFAIGCAPWESGMKAQIDVNPIFSIGLILVYVNLPNVPVSAEDPVTYTIELSSSSAL